MSQSWPRHGFRTDASVSIGLGSRSRVGRGRGVPGAASGVGGERFRLRVLGHVLRRVFATAHSTRHRRAVRTSPGGLRPRAVMREDGRPVGGVYVQRGNGRRLPATVVVAGGNFTGGTEHGAGGSVVNGARYGGTSSVATGFTSMAARNMALRHLSSATSSCSPRTLSRPPAHPHQKWRGHRARKPQRCARAERNRFPLNVFTVSAAQLAQAAGCRRSPSPSPAPRRSSTSPPIPSSTLSEQYMNLSGTDRRKRRLEPAAGHQAGR